MTSSPQVRFAPSPTGHIHVGNVRTALFNWLFAHHEGGGMLLRLDDTDTERSKEVFVDAIVEDLAWLGLTHDRFAQQSERTGAYEKAVEELKSSGRIYPCYETPEELDRKRKRRLARGLPPVYDRAALDLTDAEKSELEAQGRAPHWRFKLDPEPVTWDDLVRGSTTVETESVSDPVVIRADGSYLYMLPSAVDDRDLGITHVVRGEDHVTNTAAQIQMAQALGADAPAFGHHALLVGPDGGPLSKRLGSLSIRELREQGLEPMAVVSLLAKLGTSDPVEPRLGIAELATEFAFEKLGRAPARLDPKELEALNGKLLHLTAYDDVAERLEAMHVLGGSQFWNAIRANVTRLDDAKDWWRVISGEVTPVIEDEALVGAALRLLPKEPWDEETWGPWTNAVKAETGAKGRGLFMPLRLALTGVAHGPELKNLLPLIGRERAEARLSGRTA